MIISFKFITRSFKRSPLFLWINVVGMSVGLAVSILLLLFVVNEQSYDKHFEKHERIVRLNSMFTENGDTRIWPICNMQAFTDVAPKVPEVEVATQMLSSWGDSEIIYETERFQSIELLYSENNFFKIFDMVFLDGTPQDALAAPQTAILTGEYAKIIYGTEQAVGKTFSFNDKEYTVSGVVKKLPLNTHFNFDVLLNIESHDSYKDMGGMEFFTYYLIKQGLDVEKGSDNICKAYSDLFKEKPMGDNIKIGGIIDRLDDIHMFSCLDYGLGKKGNFQTVILVATLAILILILAITNFVNLFIVQSETRLLEIGVRKANGCGVKGIAIQFFSEAASIVFLAFVIGVGLAVISVPFFSSLIDKPIEPTLFYSTYAILLFLGILVLTVFLSGSYPAMYLSRLNTLDILGKRLKMSKRRLTAVIVIFQSVISIVLISYIIVVNTQISYLKDIPVGYNPKNILVAPMKQLDSNYESLREELLNTSGIKAVSASSHIIGSGTSGEGIGIVGEENRFYSINEYRIKPGFCEVVEFEMLEGMCFPENMPDNFKGVILNEAAIKMLDLKSPVTGQYVLCNGTETEIIGVVKDFYYDSPANTIYPIELTPTWYHGKIGNIHIRIDESMSKAKAVELVQSVFRKFDPAFMLNPIWGDEIYEQKFKKEASIAKLFFATTLLSLFISMIGLLAVHSYATIRRIKEIGIRRVNGATSFNIFRVVSIDMLKWIFIAACVALPIAYYFANDWLQGYANRINMPWFAFVFPVSIQIILAFVSTLFVTLKVLFQNPVKALKSE